MKKPDNCKSGVEFHLFKHPIKPMWEDEANKHGGKLTIHLQKDNANLIWEELVIIVINVIARLLPLLVEFSQTRYKMKFVE